jgi:hypothetical protein
MGPSKSRPAAAGCISSISLADASGDSDDEDEVPDMVVLGMGSVGLALSSMLWWTTTTTTAD